MKVRDIIKRVENDGWVLDRFEKAANNWGAFVPDLPGCVTTAPTLEDARRLIAEAIAFHIEGMRLRGYPVPEPTAVAETVEIRAA
jgi:predicted RNase H-like HicB family nuclease